MDWLEVQLSIFRARGMQVWLSGHVPPSPGNYFPDCWFRFGELTLRFQDTIIGSMFGHMNVDHWFMMGQSLPRVSYSGRLTHPPCIWPTRRVGRARAVAAES